MLKTLFINLRYQIKRIFNFLRGFGINLSTYFTVTISDCVMILIRHIFDSFGCRLLVQGKSNFICTIIKIASFFSLLLAFIYSNESIVFSSWLVYTGSCVIRRCMVMSSTFLWFASRMIAFLTELLFHCRYLSRNSLYLTFHSFK